MGITPDELFAESKYALIHRVYNLSAENARLKAEIASLRADHAPFQTQEAKLLVEACVAKARETPPGNTLWVTPSDVLNMVAFGRQLIAREGRAADAVVDAECER